MMVYPNAGTCTESFRGAPRLRRGNGVCLSISSICNQKRLHIYFSHINKILICLTTGNNNGNVKMLILMNFYVMIFLHRYNNYVPDQFYFPQVHPCRQHETCNHANVLDAPMVYCWTRQTPHI